MQRYQEFQGSQDYFFNGIPFIMEGQVVATNDPDEMGRVKVWLPALDGETFRIENLPWAEYATPLAGFTVDFPAGGYPVKNESHAAYGLWAIPKIGATVFVFCLNADPQRRFFFASSVRLHRNRSLPAGRNFDPKGRKGPWGDAGDGEGNLNPIQPAYDNLRAQFDDKLDESESITRGVYERQVAQGATEKTDEEGYGKSPVDSSYLDSQTYCFVSPGRHAWIMQDDPRFSRFRIKTAEGHQIIFDDANERIYVSTARGKSWLELDQDGHVHVFGAESISMRAGKDFNVYAERDINLEANRAVNVKANGGDIRMNTAKQLHMMSTGETFVTACGSLNLSTQAAAKMTSGAGTDIKAGSSIAISAGSAMDIGSGSGMKLSGSRIDLNGPAARQASEAACAQAAVSPSIVPGHEPWKRPEPAIKRGPNWKA